MSDLPKTNDVAALTKAVQANPTDETGKLVLADAITEATGDYPAAVEAANAIADAVVVRRERARIRRLLRGTTLALVEIQLADANGRRRARTLTIADVLDCVQKARKGADGWYAVGGSTVANAYGYPAERTVCLVALRSDGSVRVAIGEGRANAGSSLTNPVSGLSKNAGADAFREWAEEQTDGGR